MRVYEGMFLIDDGRWNENPEAALREVRGLLEKNKAQLFTCEKWDDRRLAYPIKHRTRAIYVLARFTAPSDALRTIERDCQLSELVLRVLVLRDEHSEHLAKLGQFPPKPGEPPVAPPPPPPPIEAPATGERARPPDDESPDPAAQ